MTDHDERGTDGKRSAMEKVIKPERPDTQPETETDVPEWVDNPDLIFTLEWWAW